MTSRIRVTASTMDALADLVAGRPISNTMRRVLTKLGWAIVTRIQVLDGHEQRKIYHAEPTAAGRSAHAAAEVARASASDPEPERRGEDGER